MSDTPDILERLNTACVGHPNARIPWPHRLLHDAVAEIDRLRAATKWRPMETAPKEGKFLVAEYAPTNWAYWPKTVSLRSDDPPRHRETLLKNARAWMPLPAPPRDGNEP